MKKSIYIAVVVILILVSLSILLLYYTQPFESKVSFINSIDYGDITFQTNTDYNNVLVLQSANVQVGKIDLKNSGYFSQVYSLPNYVGCIDLTDAGKNIPSLANQKGFEITFKNNGQTLYTGESIEVAVGKNTTINLIADYSPNNVPFEEFSRDRITGVSIYLSNNKQSNSGLYSKPMNYYLDCNSLQKNSKPVATISIN